MKPPHRGVILRVVFLYTLFAGLWIVFSDRMLEALIRDAHLISVLQTYKGWAFIALSAFLLYFLLRRELGLRQLAEVSRLSAEERYRNLVEQASDVIFLSNGDGKLLALNPVGQRLTLPDGDSMESLHLADLLFTLGPDPQPLTFSHLEPGKFTIEACQLRTQDGQLLPVEINARKLADGSIQGILRDVSERQKTERTLRRWADIFRFTRSGIAISASPELTLDLVNPAMAEMQGRSTDELIGMSFASLFPAEERAILYQALQEVEKDGSTSFESTHKNKEGTIFPVQVDLTAVKDEQGTFLYLIFNVQDITQRREAENSVQLQIQRLAALRSIDIAITATLDQRVTFNVLLDQVTTQLQVDAAALLLLNSITRRLEYQAHRGFRSSRIKDLTLGMGEGLPGLVVLSLSLIALPDVRQTPHYGLRHSFFDEERFISYYAVPLIAKGELKGVLEVFHRKPIELDRDWNDFLEALAGQAAIAIENTNLYESLQRSGSELAQAYDATLEGWSRALELRDRETQGHAERVTELTLLVAQEMGIADSELIHIRRGTLLHDIGKMGVPDGILMKPGPLTPEEWDVMRRHPIYAFEMLAPITFLRPALDIPYCHHERWDGSGYPRGLKGTQIPLAARIFAVVDVWDALRSDRPYRRSWSVSRVRRYLQDRAGTHFDPQVVATFLQIMPDERGPA